MNDIRRFGDLLHQLRLQISELSYCSFSSFLVGEEHSNRNCLPRTSPSQTFRRCCFFLLVSPSPPLLSPEMFNSPASQLLRHLCFISLLIWYVLTPNDKVFFLAAASYLRQTGLQICLLISALLPLLQPAVATSLLSTLHSRF